MLVTIDTLVQHGACQEGIDFLQKHFPNGAELRDLIDYRFTPTDFLHWGFLNLEATSEEQAAYWEKVGVIDSSNIFQSDHITESDSVRYSSYVTQSSVVRKSNSVTDSQLVFDSRDVESSVNVFKSTFVYHSTQVLKSNNVTGCCNIVKSTYAVDSTSVYDSQIITDSRHIRNSTNLTNARLCSDCSNLTNALFCSDCHDGECLVFNKPISPKQFAMLMERYDNFVKEETCLANKWPVGKPLFPETPVEERNWMKQYHPLPDKLWLWAESLPNFDPLLLYRITFKSSLL